MIFPKTLPAPPRKEEMRWVAVADAEAADDEAAEGGFGSEGDTRGSSITGVLAWTSKSL